MIADLNLDDLWTKIREYRHNFAAHLNFDEAIRPKNHPFLTPLRLTAEVLYSRVYCELDTLGRSSNFPPPSNMIDEPREEILSHWKVIAQTAREALQGFNNNPE